MAEGARQVEGILTWRYLGHTLFLLLLLLPSLPFPSFLSSLPFSSPLLFSTLPSPPLPFPLSLFPKIKKKLGKGNDANFFLPCYVSLLCNFQKEVDINEYSL